MLGAVVVPPAIAIDELRVSLLPPVHPVPSYIFKVKAKVPLAVGVVRARRTNDLIAVDASADIAVAQIDVPVVIARALGYREDAAVGAGR